MAEAKIPLAYTAKGWPNLETSLTCDLKFDRCHGMDDKKACLYTNRKPMSDVYVYASSEHFYNDARDNGFLWRQIEFLVPEVYRRTMAEGMITVNDKVYNFHPMQFMRRPTEEIIQARPVMVRSYTHGTTVALAHTLRPGDHGDVWMDVWILFQNTRDQYHRDTTDAVLKLL